jgi:hypothetical protein
VTKIKPAKKLFDEQKEQMGLRKEEERVEKQLKKPKIKS